jgi:hypothetical protein
LWDPGSGSQLHDYNGGILPSGLFWTVDLRRTALHFTMSSRRAVLSVKNLPVIDTFHFFGPDDTPAHVDFRAVWRSTGPAVPRGSGTSVPPTDQAAFEGEIAPAISTFECSGDEIGFEFQADRGASTGLPDPLQGYAQIGTHRNGAFL